MDAAWNELTRWRGDRLGPIDVLPDVDSTNREARRRFDAGRTADGLVLIAMRQSSGHGSRGRAWHDAPGRSLALTALLRWRSPVPLTVATWLGVVAVTDLIRALGVPVRIKWPNDALVAERKVAGVLAEAFRAGDGPSWITLGIGLNVGHAPADFPPDLATPPTSLSMEGSVIALPDAARRLLDALDRRIAGLELDGGESIRADFLERTGLAGRPVTATLPDRPVGGILRGLELDGTLLVGEERLRGGHVTALRGL